MALLRVRSGVFGKCLLTACILLSGITESGEIVRSRAAVQAFKNQTGYPNGRPGFVVDHIVPLACGGLDKPINMEWQTIKEGKEKDQWERKDCTIWSDFTTSGE